MRSRIKFTSTLREITYLKTMAVYLRRCFQFLIAGAFVTVLFTYFQTNLDMFFATLATMVIIVLISGIILKYGYRLEHYGDIILVLVSFGLLANQVFSLRAINDDQVDYRSIHIGYIFGLFERIISTQLSRVESKVLFLIGSLILRIFVFSVSSDIIVFHQFAWWLIAAFMELLIEKDSRRLFKSFLDDKSELLKFKNLMVSGLPINILLLSKKLDRKLFMNEYFQTTFHTKPDHNETAWNLTEWLNRFRIEKEGLKGSSRDALGEEANIEVTLLDMINLLISKRLLEDPSHQFCFNVRTYETDKTKKIYMVKIFLLPWGGEDAIAVILNDVTLQYQNLTLRVADTNKDRMIAMVSHELRTPLNGILGMIHIMEKQVTDSQVLTYLAVCKNSGKLLLNLVNSILDLGQIRNKKFQLKISKGYINDLLQEIFLLFEFQFKAKGLFLKMNITQDLPPFIVTDLNRLKQIIINLIGNALKFTFEGGVEIFVALDPNREGYLQFKIADTGIGIKQEDQKKLFKMYGRLNQTDMNMNSEGVGLGLTISDHLVRLLSEGEDDEGIKVESELDNGTTFCFSIKANSHLTLVTEEPAEYNVALSEGREHSQSMESQDPNIKLSHYVLETNSFSCQSPSPKNRKLLNTPLLKGLFNSRRVSESGLLSPKDNFSKDTFLHCRSSFHTEETALLKPFQEARVLLVDDSPFNIMVAKHLIESLGFQVETAMNGKIAVDMVKEFVEKKKTFKMIFMDCQMPVMDGYEATKILCSLMAKQDIPDTPIVALSAIDRDEDKDKCKEVGMRDHLSKPLNEARLRQVLENFCK